MGSFTSTLLNEFDNQQTTISYNKSSLILHDNNNSTTNFTISLPDDLLMQILIKLPIKSQLNCRCVCKSWYSLITCSTFITLHLNHNLYHTYHNETIIRQRWNENSGNFRFTLHKDNKTLDWITELDPPVIGFDQFYKMLDCVGGFVCLYDDSKSRDNLVLWNPSIKKVLMVPNPTIESDLVESDFYGFGFDPLNSEYKIVRISYVSGDSSSLVEVFRVKTQSWVRIDGCYSGFIMPSIISQQAYVDGHVNWVTSNHMILAFDVGNEVFKEMLLPKDLDKVDIQNLTLAVWKGFLSVFAFENCGCLIYGRVPAGRASLWVMREYGVVESWTRQFSIEPYATYRQVRGIHPNGRIIFEDIYSNLITSDPETRLIERLALRVQGSLSAFHMKRYIENLVLLDLGKTPQMQPGSI